MSAIIRTRFAPSPTGYLHVGGARTALFNWLYARKMGGQFILRIEDTDRERSTEASVQAIFDGMHWLGLNWDTPPIFQTQRFDRYQQVLERLLHEGKAYRCYCTKERLEELRQLQTANKEKPRYDGHCRELSKPRHNQPFVVRFKNPLQGKVSWVDAVHGEIAFDNAELDDLILQRSDGVFTYNFCVVIDDWDMNITHVFRGDDHINNTPRQLNLYQALHLTPPVFGHLPMILGADGGRLSKRHGAVSVMQYRDEGYLPEALLNYLVRLGWSHGDQEIFSKEEMTAIFDANHLNKSAATFNPEKLLWLNQHYLKSLPIEYVAAQSLFHFSQQSLSLTVDKKLIEIIKVQRERCKTLKELAEKSLYFYQEITANDEEAFAKHLNDESQQGVSALYYILSELEDWCPDRLHAALEKVSETTSLKLGKFGPLVRIALTGGTTSPALDLTLYLLGKETSCRRLKDFMLKF